MQVLIAELKKNVIDNNISEALSNIDKIYSVYNETKDILTSANRRLQEVAFDLRRDKDHNNHRYKT